LHQKPSLSAIKDVRAVNNLAPEQALSFTPNGVTIVYGDNGAGPAMHASSSAHAVPVIQK
jgi:hypothetical protein